jgi:hypothetical protein
MPARRATTGAPRVDQRRVGRPRTPRSRRPSVPARHRSPRTSAQPDATASDQAPPPVSCITVSPVDRLAPAISGTAVAVPLTSAAFGRLPRKDDEASRLAYEHLLVSRDLRAVQGALDRDPRGRLRGADQQHAQADRLDNPARAAGVERNLDPRRHRRRDRQAQARGSRPAAAASALSHGRSRVRCRPRRPPGCGPRRRRWRPASLAAARPATRDRRARGRLRLVTGDLQRRDGRGVLESPGVEDPPAGHRCILGSCVGSAYMCGQLSSMASGRSS